MLTNFVRKISLYKISLLSIYSWKSLQVAVSRPISRASTFLKIRCNSSLLSDEISAILPNILNGEIKQAVKACYASEEMLVVLSSEGKVSITHGPRHEPGVRRREVGQRADMTLTDSGVNMLNASTQQ